MSQLGEKGKPCGYFWEHLRCCTAGSEHVGSDLQVLLLAESDDVHNKPCNPAWPVPRLRSSISFTGTTHTTQLDQQVALKTRSFHPQPVG